MRLTERSDYALRVLMYLGATGEAATVGTMAVRLNVSHHHLEKVVQMLCGHGFVATTRGRGGGVRLAKEPQEIRIGDVVGQTEPDFALVECMRAALGEEGGMVGGGGKGGGCPLQEPCRLAGLLRDAQRAFVAVLDDATLADLIVPRRALLRSLGGLGERKGVEVEH